MGAMTAPGRLPDPAFWRSRRVLVTGHTGFKGGWLTLWLRRLGAQVSGLSLPAEAETLADGIGLEALVPSIACDIRDAAATAAAVERVAPEIVLHLAAQALVRRSYAEPVETFATNVMGTAHVLDALRRVPGARAAVIVTTDKCYENREWDWAYREDDRLGGHDPYSASKACVELTAACWRRSFPDGLAVATARAGNVIGGGDWSPDRLVPDCIRAFAAGRAARIRSPASTRPWQHVLDPLCGYLLLAEGLCERAQDRARAWNFGPSAEGSQSVAAVVERLAEAWGGDAHWVAEAASGPHEAGRLAVDASRARGSLGWRPRLSLDEAAAWTGRWHRMHADGADPAALIADDIERYEAAR